MIALVASALAAPSFGLMLGGGLIGGESQRSGYASASPVLAASVDWRFAYVETWLGLSATAFIAPYQGEPVPAALLQGEVGLGLGNPNVSGGVFLGAGLSGGEGGLYGRLMFPGPTWAPRLGGEVRVFHLGSTDSAGAMLLARAEFGGRRSAPKAPPPPIYHDDPLR